MDVLLVDASLALLLLGFVSLIRPLRVLRIRTRRTAAVLAAAGLALFAVGLFLPVSPPHLRGPRMALDDILPDYQFGETHEVRIQASPERVLTAVKAVTAHEIRFFRLLTWLRAPHFGEAPQSILNPAADRPILEVALQSGFVVLHEEAGREIVLGTVVCCGLRHTFRDAFEFRALQGSLARAAMNFHVTDEGGGVSRLVTQTRVAASDAPAERRFAAYWRVIYPGSAFIRRMWLRAIKARAELTP
jgi:hypothetical protein